MTFAREVLDSEQFRKIVERLKDSFDDEGALNLDEWRQEDTRTLYELGFTLYKMKEYNKAETIFRKLVIVMPLEKSHWQGLASSLQMQNRFEDALVHWSMYAFIDPNSPIPHFHAAECLFKIGDYKDCLKALSALRERDLNKEYEEKAAPLKLAANAHLEKAYA